jgi:hypothetical protein
MMRWARNVTRMGRRGMHIVYRWERQNERERRMWMDNIKIDLR